MIEWIQERCSLHHCPYAANTVAEQDYGKHHKTTDPKQKAQDLRGQIEPQPDQGHQHLVAQPKLGLAVTTGRPLPIGTGQPLLFAFDPQRRALRQESLELADADPCKGFENRRLRLEAFICEQHVRFLSVKDVRLSPQRTSGYQPFYHFAETPIPLRALIPRHRQLNTRTPPPGGFVPSGW